MGGSDATGAQRFGGANRDYRRIKKPSEMTSVWGLNVEGDWGGCLGWVVQSNIVLFVQHTYLQPEGGWDTQLHSRSRANSADLPSAL